MLGRMDELTADTGAEFLRGLANISGVAPDDAEVIRFLAQWATPKHFEVVLAIARQVTDIILSYDWLDVPASQAQPVMAQPAFVFLHEPATGMQSAPDGELVHIPQEMVFHFVRLSVLMACDHTTPEILDGVRIFEEAEQRARASREDDTASRHQRAAITDHLEQLMVSEVAEHPELGNFITTVLLFLVTDDPDEALRLEVP